MILICVYMRSLCIFLVNSIEIGLVISVHLSEIEVEQNIHICLSVSHGDRQATDR